MKLKILVVDDEPQIRRQLEIALAGYGYEVVSAINGEDAIRKAIWLGGDSDTLACITGGIAEAYYGEMKADWVEKAYELMPREFGEVIARFKAAFAK